MAMEFQVYQKPHLIVEWTTQVPIAQNTQRSADFVAFNTTSHLSFFCGSVTAGVLAFTPTTKGFKVINPNCVYELKLNIQNPPPTPLNITACVLRNSESILPETTRIEQQNDDCVIWSCTQSELSEVFPCFQSADGSFEQESRSFSFWVSIHAGRPVFSEDKSIQTPAHVDADFGIESLSGDLSKLLKDDGPSADVQLVCRGRTFTAHRCLLSVRSDVFKAMLESDMAEGNTGRVEIEDAEEAIFQRFLEYLYNGRLEEWTLDIATQLYKLADRYAVGALKKQCGSYLEDNLTRDSACDVLSLADLHSDVDLKEIATAYIVGQKIPLQEDKSKWSRFTREHPLLAVEVMTRLCELLASCQ